MERIYHATAAPDLPEPQVSGDPGYFRTGAPGGATSTIVTATWANGVQEELVTVIDAAAIALDVTDNTQLLDAIRFLIAEYVDAQHFVPVGSMMWRAAASAPEGWLYCDGRAVSRSTYNALFAAIGTTFGGGNGSTTFNLPNLQHRFVRGYSDDDNDTFGEALADQVKAHNHAVTVTGAGAVAQQTLTSTVNSGHTHSVNGATGLTSVESAAHTHTFTTASGGSHTHSIAVKYDYAVAASTLYMPFYGPEWGNNQGAHYDLSIPSGSANPVSHTHTGTTVGPTPNHHQHTVTLDAEAAHTHNTVVPAMAAHTHTASSANNGSATETRPPAICLYPMIKV